MGLAGHASQVQKRTCRAGKTPSSKIDLGVVGAWFINCPFQYRKGQGGCGLGKRPEQGRAAPSCKL